MTHYRIHGRGLAGCTTAWQLWLRGAPCSFSDHSAPASSQVAAGIVQPVTGKNAAVSSDYAAHFAEASHFYQRIEQILGCRFWQPLHAIRLVSAAESEKFLPKFTSGAAAAYFTAQLETHQWPGMHAIQFHSAARLDVPIFIAATREFFASQPAIPSASPSENIYCTGAAGLMADHPRSWPQRCAKGEILTVHAPTWQQENIVSAGAWLVPIGADVYKVGATYDWNLVDHSPTAAGRMWLEKAAARLGGSDFTVIDHQAGIRPIVRKSQPIIGPVPGCGSIVFNALGSKGALYAPACARLLTEHLLDTAAIPAYFSAAEYFSGRA